MFQNLNPLDKTTAVLEITIMVVVAFLIGFFVCWLIRKKKEKQMQQEIDQQTAEKEKALAELQKTKEEKENLEKQLKDEKEKSEKLRKNYNEVKKELQEHEKLNYELQYKHEKHTSKFSSKEEAAKELGFELADEAHKEDLTQINGIGPFIQEKLNELGIYTVKQISQFNNETAEKVSDAIKFFPGRIKRDRWIEQAKEIIKK